MTTLAGSSLCRSCCTVQTQLRFVCSAVVLLIMTTLAGSTLCRSCCTVQTQLRFVCSAVVLFSALEHCYLNDRKVLVWVSLNYTRIKTVLYDLFVTQCVCMHSDELKFVKQNYQYLFWRNCFAQNADCCREYMNLISHLFVFAFDLLFWIKCNSCQVCSCFSFSALTLLVGWQEGHPPCKI